MLKRTQIIPTLFLLFPNLLPASAGQSFPAEPCQQAWSQNSAEDFLFNYTKDTQLTSRGNEGYGKYQNRMKSAGLVERKDCYKDWTFLIYMSATQELVPYALADLIDMESGDTIDGTAITTEGSINLKALRSSSPKIDVVVQLATDTDREIQRLHMFHAPQSKASVLKKEDLPQLARTHIQSPTVMILNKDLSASERRRLEEFLKWGIQEYPSEHIAVFVWGHGQGWTAHTSSGKPSSMPAPEVSSPEQQDQMQMQAQTQAKPRSQKLHGRFGGLGLAQSTGYLDIPGLKSVLVEVKDWSNGKAIDIFAADACLMQSVEDVSHLSDCADYICGPEDLESYAGYPYGSMFCHVNSDRNFDAVTDSFTHGEGEAAYIAAMIPKLYKESFGETGSQKDIDPTAANFLTSCSVSTQHLKRSLLPALDHLGTALLKFVEEEPRRFMDIKDLMQKGPYYQGGTQDLGVFLMGLEDLMADDVKNHGNKTTKAAGDLLYRLSKARYALTDTVVGFALGKNYKPSSDPWKRSGPRGLSIWMPERDDEFHKRIEDYSQCSLYQKTGWKAFMTKMYPKR